MKKTDIDIKYTYVSTVGCNGFDYMIQNDRFVLFLLICQVRV